MCSLPILFSSTGKANLTFTVPDTITEWKASMFCVAEEAGFGISVPASLTAFQMFFVEMTLPYSIIRGEDFLLRANVFNYMGTCNQVCPFFLPLNSHPFLLGKAVASFLGYNMQQHGKFIKTQLFFSKLL